MKMGEKMKSLIDGYTLSNGVKIPCIGFGTWQTPDGEATTSAVKAALVCGYRHIDTAAIYGNEKSVGLAIKESAVDRKDVFVTSKLFNTEHTYQKTKAAFKKHCKILGLNTLIFI
jgi:diketogulonate reductase-like aldo/keto reductase